VLAGNLGFLGVEEDDFDIVAGLVVRDREEEVLVFERVDAVHHLTLVCDVVELLDDLLRVHVDDHAFVRASVPVDERPVVVGREVRVAEVPGEEVLVAAVPLLVDV
jgi:hypothetical protein